MKKTIYNFLLIFAAISAFSVAFIGCKDEDLTGPSRLFRPVLKSDNIVTGMTTDTVPFIKVTWDKYTDANQYVVKAVAADGTDSVSITTDSISCTFTNLKFDTEYNIKIHSVNTTNGLESKDYVANVTTPDFPTQLLNISSTNIIDTQVRLLWSRFNSQGSPTVYDTIKVYNALTNAIEISSAVTSDELASGSKIIRNLHPQTSYRVEAFHAGKYNGKKLFTTTASESYSGLVIDLRGLTADDSYKYFSVNTGSLYLNKVDSIVKANPDQNITFVLQGGVTYRLPTLSVPSTAGRVKFVTGLSLSGMASFAVSGNFDAPASAVVGGIDFQKLFFTDAPLEGKAKTADANYGGTYIFNLSGPGSNIKSITFDNCVVKYKRGVLRCKDAAVVDTFKVNNCVFDSIANYGITSADFATCKITNIIVKNSTFSSCQVLFGGTKQASSPINTIDIENNTFVYCIANGGYLFNYSGCTVNNFILKNCVFGVSGKTPSDPLTTGVRGWSGTVSPMADGCYFTNDYLWQINVATGVPYAQISGTTLSTNTVQTFEAPAKSDFKVISNELKKLKAGDPRWY